MRALQDAQLTAKCLYLLTREVGENLTEPRRQERPFQRVAQVRVRCKYERLESPLGEDPAMDPTHERVQVLGGSGMSSRASNGSVSKEIRDRGDTGWGKDAWAPSPCW